MTYTLSQATGFMRAIERRESARRRADALMHRAAAQYTGTDFRQYLTAVSPKD